MTCSDHVLAGADTADRVHGVPDAVDHVLTLVLLAVVPVLLAVCRDHAPGCAVTSHLTSSEKREKSKNRKPKYM